MCGIFAYLSNKTIIQATAENIQKMANTIKHRGPDQTNYKVLYNGKIMYFFHRLKIVDLSDDACQPFKYNDYYSICNGEIYNYITLKKKYNLSTNTNCDCEILSPLLDKVGINTFCKSLDGVFSSVILNNKDGTVWVTRDPFGVRSLYIGNDDIGNMIISSEMKSFPSSFNVKPFPPGHYGKISLINNNWKFEYIQPYYSYDFIPNNIDDEKILIKKIKYLLEEGVTKRMMSNRPIGCLLSGGLDSSIITAILAKNFKNRGEKLRTFSVGLKGSEDLKYAKLLSEYLDTEHYSLVITEEDMLKAIPKDIFMIESYDTTTVRASTPMFLLCQYIKQNTDITVIFSGEGSDEASGSYMYFHNAPDAKSFQNESIKLLKELHYFDVLRCDKSSAAVGLEIRVPFLDLDFMNFYMGIDPKFKMTNGGIEKRLLREAFKDMLPKEITFRQKEGMSDGVSSQKKSWASIISDKVDTLYTDEDINNVKDIENPPLFKEAKYYRDIFNSHFGKRDHLIPHYWLPNWSGDIKDPSARLLDVYKNEEVLDTIDNNTAPIDNDTTPIDNNTAPIDNDTASINNDTASINNDTGSIDNDTASIDNDTAIIDKN